MSLQFQVFVGYDPRQPVAERVCTHSLMRHASKPVPVTRLQLSQLPLTRRGLTEFTYSRFLAPHLSGYDGYSLFLDADMLVRGDICSLLKTVDPMSAVSVVQRSGDRAFEMASFMLFNNKRCRNLTPEYVEDPTHRLFDMAWASKIGVLPKEWNHLVGYDVPNPAAQVVHFTQGIPCWPETAQSEWAEAWREEVALLTSTVSFAELMGGSVHPVARQVRDMALKVTT